MSVLETARVWEGARVAVIGCGAVGLSAIQGARIARASEIRAIDIDERKREQATHFGATHTEPGPVDFVFDVVSRAATFEQALGMIATGGTVVVVGLAPTGETATVDLPALFRRRARVLVSHGGDHLPHEDFPRLAQWALDGQPRPRVDGDANGRARRLERRVRRYAGWQRDSNGSHSMSLATLQRIIDGSEPAPPGVAAPRLAHRRCGGGTRRRSSSTPARSIRARPGPCTAASSAISRTQRWAVRSSRCSTKARRLRPSS